MLNARRRVHGSFAAACSYVVLTVIGGCESTGASQGISVESAVGNRHTASAKSGNSSADGYPAGEPPQQVAGLTGRRVDPVATVSGVSIARSRLVDLLIEGRGLVALEQLIVLEAARQRARSLGMIVSKADTQREYDASLETLLADNVTQATGELKRQAGEAMLDDLLRRRGVARSEYMVVMERNAYLRKLAQKGVSYTPEQVRAEFEQNYGEKVEVRHIQIKSPTTLDEVLAERRKGIEFSELAVRFSANRASAERLGLLPTFGKTDPNVPELLRQTAFAMSAGDESEPLFVDGWYHILRLERRIEPSETDFASIRDEVEQALRRKLVDARMRSLTAELFRDAEIEIADPMLRAAFLARHESDPAIDAGNVR